MALFTKPNENIFRFSAFDGQKDMEKIDSEAQKLLHPKTYLEFKKMSPGEKGCTMSHLQLISNIFYETKHECVLICEDDIVLEHYKQKMEKLLPIIPDSADIVQLHIANPQVVISSSSLQFYKWKNQNWSTSAYLIFRNGMEKLLKMVKERVVIYPRANTIVYSPVTTYTVQPPLFITNESPSTIHPSHEGIHKKANDKILSAQQDTEYLS
jgi:GR25 family glycosyltransferase involved in LPS biosynthesis